MITRISKLKGFNNLIAGRDLAGIFKDGHVYSVTEIMGEITIRDLGEHAVMERYKGSGFAAIIMDGSYCLTKEEKELDEKQKRELDADL